MGIDRKYCLFSARKKNINRKVGLVIFITLYQFIITKQVEVKFWNVARIKKRNTRILLTAGVISKSKLYSEYRKLMVQLSDE